MLLDKEITKEIVEGVISMIIEAITAPFRHIRRWNEWRKYNINSKLHKFLVLMGFVYSPTFDMFDRIRKKEREMIAEGVNLRLGSLSDYDEEDEFDAD